MTTTSTNYEHGFSQETIKKRGGERAPHKPLLALYAIKRVLCGESRMVPYAQVARDLGKLLMEFGPRRQSYHPVYPF
jgi:putative restriction endonuclease